MLNKNIFETIYFAAMTASKDLAKEQGAYESFEGSPVSKGIFQFDMWGVEPSDRWDWTGLKEEVKKYGVRNSLLLAPMPTASTSQIFGNNECFEPYTSNIYSRRVLSGEFVIVNKHLLKDLVQLGLWNNDMKNKIILPTDPFSILKKFLLISKRSTKRFGKLKQRHLIDMAADRGAFICQSQSLNLFVEKPTTAKLTSMHFYAWKKGLKTGMYYLRTQAATQAVQFTIEKKEKTLPVPVSTDGLEINNDLLDGSVCTMEDGCVSCGS